eukprot:jgi/Orpsp1_1/1186721/evm.model.d7180000052788.1
MEGWRIEYSSVQLQSNSTSVQFNFSPIQFNSVQSNSTSVQFSSIQFSFVQLLYRNHEEKCLCIIRKKKSHLLKKPQ